MKNKLIFRWPAITAQHRPISLEEYFGIRPGPGERLSSYDLSTAENREYEIFRMVCDAWRHYRERDRISQGDDYQARVWVRTMLRHLRAAWEAHHASNDLLAKYEFRTAETYWLRLGMHSLSAIAGRALLLQQKRQIAGEKSAARRWENTAKERNKRDTEIRNLAAAGTDLDSITERYGIGPRRVQQINKKPKAK